MSGSGVSYNDRVNVTDQLRAIQQTRHANGANPAPANNGPIVNNQLEGYNPGTYAQVPPNANPQPAYNPNYSAPPEQYNNANQNYAPAYSQPAYQPPQPAYQPPPQQSYQPPRNPNNYGRIYNDPYTQPPIEEPDDPTPINCFILITCCIPLCGCIGLCVYSRFWNNPNYPNRTQALKMLALITGLAFVINAIILTQGVHTTS